MKFEKIHNKGQARIFKNKYLEYITKTHPLVIWGMYVPVISFMLYYGHIHFGFGFIRILFVFLAGMFSWSFFEYTIHRYVFHFIAQSKKALRIVYIIHGNHHEYPRDKKRLFMPALPSLLISASFFMLLYAVAYLFAIAGYAFVFFPGFLVGYLIYGTMHYTIHACNPPFKWMKPLWRNHHLHHYKKNELGFGVSSTLWDHVFCTMFDLTKEKEDKEKVKELMFAPKEREVEMQEN